MKTGLILNALLMEPAAAAQAAPAAASERRLSPEQIEMVLAEAAKKREAADREARPEAVDRAPRQMHGEFGVSLGTGGHREAFGTAVYPMEYGGAAAISFDFVDLGRRRYKR